MGLNLPDGIHPNAAGHEILADNVVPMLREVLRALAREAGDDGAAASPGELRRPG